MGDESLIKVIFYFLLVSIGAGLVQMKIPLFGRHSKRWEEQNYAQRFGGIFFPTFIALVVIFLFNEYNYTLYTILFCMTLSLSVILVFLLSSLCFSREK